MTNCHHCGTTILFGGVTDGPRRYCKAACHQAALSITAAVQIPDEVVEQNVRELHSGRCPRCQGIGPVDVHVAHQAMSFLIMTQWKSNYHVCCQPCARKSQWGALALTATVGWWGFPWGLIVTPMQICRNLGAMGSSPNPTQPSALLYDHVRTAITQHVLRSPRNAPPPLPPQS